MMRGGMASLLLDAAVSLCMALEVHGTQSSKKCEEAADTIQDYAAALNNTCYAIACTLKLPFDAAFMEVQHSNMAKRLKDGTVFHDAGGKLMKPEGFIKPNLKYVLKHGKPKKRPTYTKPPKDWKPNKKWLALHPIGETVE